MTGSGIADLPLVNFVLNDEVLTLKLACVKCYLNVLVTLNRISAGRTEICLVLVTQDRFYSLNVVFVIFDIPLYLPAFISSST
jgi:hypothetical protein